MKKIIAALVAALLLLLYAFSLWAEWGPYAWLAGAQFAVFHSYEVPLTFVGVSLLFAVPLIFAWKEMGSGRTSLCVAFGVPAAAVAAHLSLTLFFAVTGGTAADSTTFRSAVQDAGFLPKRFRMDEAALWPLDEARAAGEHSSASDEQAYIPFEAPSGDEKLPVVLEFDSGEFSRAPDLHPLEGLIYKAPLPYLVRRQWAGEGSTFAVIIKSRKSVREFWIWQGIFYVVISALLGWFWRKSSRAAAA